MQSQDAVTDHPLKRAATLFRYTLDSVYTNRTSRFISSAFSVQCGFSELMQRIYKHGDIQNTRTSLTLDQEKI